MNPGRIVTFGEVLLRLSPPADELFFHTPALRTFWGGAEANVACGLAWLGARAAHVTVLPTNALGDAALAALAHDGVETHGVQRATGRLGLYFLDGGSAERPLSVTYDRAGSAFATMRGDEFDWPALLAGAAWFHVSGVSAALGDGPYAAVQAAIHAAASLNVPVSLDLNYRPALWQGRDPRPFMQPLASRAHTLIGNPGAIELMLGITTAGTYPETREAVAEAARTVHQQYGCARVAVTQREIIHAAEHGWQAHVYDAATDVMYSAPRYQRTVVDRVGGGDSFVAALLYQLQQRAPLETALHFATAASALKLSVVGDVNRVTAHDVSTFLSTVR